MNVFILDENPALAARYHMDVHVVKMVLESAQLLSTCFLHFDIVGDKSKVYKPTHPNHPCSVWLRESFSNVVWLYQLLKELLYEYTYRFGRIHACSRLVPYFSRCLTKLSKQQQEGSGGQAGFQPHAFGKEESAVHCAMNAERATQRLRPGRTTARPGRASKCRQ